VADLLDLPLASEKVRGSVTGAGRRQTWAELPGAGVAAARLGVDRLEGDVVVHDGLTVAGRPVSWWPDGPVDHVDGTAAALGRALAWRVGDWAKRQALAEAFAFPDRAAELSADDSIA
jgi:hypothetical protein